MPVLSGPRAWGELCERLGGRSGPEAEVDVELRLQCQVGVAPRQVQRSLGGPQALGPADQRTQAEVSKPQPLLQKVLGDVSTAMRENANDYALNEQQTTDAARRILANLV